VGGGGVAFSFANEQSTFLVVQRARDRNNARAIHLAYSSAASNTRTTTATTMRTTTTIT